MNKIFIFDKKNTHKKNWKKIPPKIVFLKMLKITLNMKKTKHVIFIYFFKLPLSPHPFPEK